MTCYLAGSNNVSRHNIEIFRHGNPFCAFLVEKEVVFMKKILQDILGAPNKNFAKILTKVFRNRQDSEQELQGILHLLIINQVILKHFQITKIP